MAVNEVPGDATGEWGTRRRALVWVNVCVQSLLMLALLVALTALGRKSGKRFDLTVHQANELSPLTEDALRGINFEVTVWMNASTYVTVEDRTLGAAWDRTRSLLEEFKKRSPRIQSYFMGEADPDAIALVTRHWPNPTPNTIYLLATFPDKKPAKRTVELYQLYQGNPSTGEITSFHGENVLLQALRELAGGAKRIVYESEGHQEILTEDKQRLSTLQHFMTQNEGAEIRRFNASLTQSVPEDGDLLLVIGPAQPFNTSELEVLRGYLERGGSLFVALRPRVKSGLEPLLEEYGVKVGNNVVLDPQDSAPNKYSVLVLRRFHLHDINRGMVNTRIIFPESCSLAPVEKGAGWKTAPIARTSPAAWGETSQIRPGDNPRPDTPEEERGEQAVIMAVEKPARSPRDDRHTSAKLIVWGSTIALTDQLLNPPGFPRETEITYLLNNLRWLIDRELLEVKPKPGGPKPIDISAEALVKVKWVTLAGFPALGVVLGLLTWYFRRK